MLSELKIKEWKNVNVALWVAIFGSMITAIIILFVYKREEKE